MNEVSMVNGVGWVNDVTLLCDVMLVALFLRIGTLHYICIY